MRLRVWGARGSLASPGADTLIYGGNTACIDVRCGPHRLILDAGSGLRALGAAMLQDGQPVDADLLLSHLHLDHVCGLPYFAPLFRAENRLRLWAGNLAPPHTLAGVVASLLTHPLNPDLLPLVRAAVTYHEFRAGETLTLQPGLAVRSAPLRHPGGSTGYRISWAGRSLAYLTDVEHVAGAPDPAVLSLIAGADVLIFDAAYSEAEYARRIGWGHSTWAEAVRLADAAGARRLVLFHHDLGRGDAEMAALEAAAAAQRPGTVAAREGMEIDV